MKYKLINIKTKEETLCEKLTRGKFDYYVSNITYVNKDETYYDTFQKELKTSNCEQQSFTINKVIATNNPNIDIPKVVDEVERISYDWLYDEETVNKAHQGYSLKPMEYGFISGYNKSQETHPFSENDVIAFSEWCNKEYEFDSRSNEWFHGNGYYATKELFKIWQEQRPKIIYYG